MSSKMMKVDICEMCISSKHFDRHFNTNNYLKLKKYKKFNLIN